jgi:hypothetical protein
MLKRLFGLQKKIKKHIKPNDRKQSNKKTFPIGQASHRSVLDHLQHFCCSTQLLYGKRTIWPLTKKCPPDIFKRSGRSGNSIQGYHNQQLGALTS